MRTAAVCVMVGLVGATPALAQSNGPGSGSGGASGATLVSFDARPSSPSNATATISPSTVPQAMEMMTQGRFRHLPVMDGDQLLGVVSIGDIVKARLSQQEQEVDSLKAYVAGAA